MSDTFCVIPWVQIASKPIGTARVCCLMTNSKDKNQGVIRDNNGNPYNLGKDDFDLIKNGDKAKEVRLSMLNGERHPDCITCWTKEDMGASSKRIVSNRMYSGEFELIHAIDHTDKEGNTDIEPSYWDLRFGNLCNLKCVMCHPASSSQWYEDYVLLNNTSHFNDSGTTINLTKINNRFKDLGEYSWWDNMDFWKKLGEKIPYLKRVYLVGGEPMLIEPHYDFLKKIIDSGRAAEVSLEYDTNLTSVPKKAINLWKQFKKIYLRVSVDDFDNQFNYVRYPAKWKQISKNLDKIVCCLSNVQVDYTVTWQVLTAYTTPNLLRYLAQHRSANLKSMYSSVHIRILSNPEYFDVAILPKRIKLELIDIYKNFNKEGTNIQVNHLIKYLESNMQQNEKQVKNFLEIITKMDLIRGTDWKTTFPELSEKIL